MNEFDITSEKQIIINKLKEVHSKYVADYYKFIDISNGPYTFKVTDYYWPQNSQETKKKEGYFQFSPINYFIKYTTKDYNFDNQTLRIHAIKINTMLGNNYGVAYNWVNAYRDHMLKRGGHNKKCTEYIDLPLDKDIARIMFADDGVTYCETFFTVTPSYGAMGNFSNHVTRFKINEITKVFYNKSNFSENERKAIGQPSHTVVIKVDDNCKPVF